jgi:2-polyprenyl-3-methyl-5-hydroxy-6-metoxy-1,4-benzoquinol methylase
MNYKEVYTKNYFNGTDSFFYSLGYTNSFLKFYLNTLFKPLQKYCNELQSANVLDVGCAYGFMLEKFPKHFKKYGLDVSEHAISEAKKLLPKATLKVGGAEDAFPFPENHFDIVTCNDVLEHLENPRKALEHIKHVMKKGGILYINTPNFNLLRKVVFAKPDKLEHHISLMTHEKLKKLLLELGFQIEELYTYTSLPAFFFLKFRANIGHEQAFICRK